MTTTVEKLVEVIYEGHFLQDSVYFKDVDYKMSLDFSSRGR